MGKVKLSRSRPGPGFPFAVIRSASSSCPPARPNTLPTIYSMSPGPNPLIVLLASANLLSPGYSSLTSITTFLRVLTHLPLACFSSMMRSRAMRSAVHIGQ